MRNSIRRGHGKDNVSWTIPWWCFLFDIYIQLTIRKNEYFSFSILLQSISSCVEKYKDNR